MKVLERPDNLSEHVAQIGGCDYITDFKNPFQLKIFFNQNKNKGNIQLTEKQLRKLLDVFDTSSFVSLIGRAMYIYVDSDNVIVDFKPIR